MPVHKTTIVPIKIKKCLLRVLSREGGEGDLELAGDAALIRPGEKAGRDQMCTK